MSNLVKLYDLRTETARAVELEKAISSHEKNPSPWGGVGSPHWWAAIEIGRLPVKITELAVEDYGMIDGVKMWEEPDFMFLVRGKDGRDEWWAPPAELESRKDEVKRGDKIIIKKVEDPRSQGSSIIIEIWKEAVQLEG